MENIANLELLFENLGNILYEIRLEKKEKLMSVAASVGISHPVISQIENGRYRALSFKLLAKISRHYQIDMHQLLDSALRKNTPSEAPYKLSYLLKHEQP